jgi:hypothetical protein
MFRYSQAMQSVEEPHRGSCAALGIVSGIFATMQLSSCGTLHQGVVLMSLDSLIVAGCLLYP